MDPDAPPAPEAEPDYVRPAGQGDLTTLVELAAASSRAAGAPTTEEHLHANLRVLVGAAANISVAVHDRVVVGFAVSKTNYTLRDGLIAEIHDLYVAPAARGCGFGDALISDAAEWAYLRGTTRLHLTAPSRDAHLATYLRRRGFVDQGRQLHFLPVTPPA